MTQDFIDEGRTLLQREKRLRLRQGTARHFVEMNAIEFSIVTTEV